MRKVHLHGTLKKHGAIWDLDVLTAAEAIAALRANKPEIVEDLRHGSWVVLRGDPETGIALDEEAVSGMQLGNADLHIMPEVEGAKNSSGTIKAVLGVALIVASGGSAAFLGNPILAAGSLTWGNAMTQMGLAMALTGVSTMLAPEQESTDEEKSKTLTGPVSRYGQGQAIPIVYGEIITGGTLVSGGIDADGLESVTEIPTPVNNPDAVEADPYNHADDR